MNIASEKLYWIYEALWLLVSFCIFYLIVKDFYSIIDRGYLFYIALTMLLSINYLRWILFPGYSLVMRKFWPKTILAFINIPLFILILKYFFLIIEHYSIFDFTYGFIDSFFIKEGTSLELIQFIKQVTIASASSFFILAVIFELRAVQITFKWRQVPSKYLR